ncbi:MAG: hypothetical protein IKM42_06460 [Clostridia bacterium]|nr:hypothetical protein [Clostridia bacterium]MBR7112766.1 hypothetical protein [Clostridia bacterium]
MRKILNLLHLQIDNRTDILKTASPRKMGAALFKVLLLLAAIIAALFLALPRIFLLGFAINAELIALVILIMQGISLMFTIGHVISTLYLSRDNELLICLPVTPNQFFISKVLMIYIKELAFHSVLFFPVFLCLGIFGGMPASYYCAMPLYMLLLPIVPIIIASFLSIPVMRVLTFLKRHAALAILVLLGLVAICLTTYISLLSSVMESFDIVEQQMQIVSDVNKAVLAIGGKILVYYQLAEAMISFSLWYRIPLFILLCALLSTCTILLIRPFYFRIAMPQLENRTTRAAKQRNHFRRDIPFISLIKKEAVCIFRAPSEVFQYFLFTLLMPFIVFFYDRLLLTASVNQAGVNMIAGSHVMIVAIMAMLSNISSASAISRDSSNFHTSKIIPVSYFTQVFAKLTFNAIFTLGALLVTAVFSCFRYPVWQIVLGSIAIAFAAVGHIALCLDMDIKNPTVSMQGDEESSTTSKSTPLALVIALAIGFVMGLFIILQSSAKHAALPYVLLIVGAFAFAVWRVWHLILRIALAYDKIEM